MLNPNKFLQCFELLQCLNARIFASFLGETADDMVSSHTFSFQDQQFAHGAALRSQYLLELTMQRLKNEPYKRKVC